MELQIVAIYDVKLEAFNRPAFVRSVGEAMRSFSDEANRSDSEVSKHPADYRLFHLGSFDDVTAQFKDGQPKLLASAETLVVSK